MFKKTMFCFFIIPLISSSIILAQISEAISVASLTGLTGVKVSVKDVTPDVQQDGLRTEHIQRDVELPLRTTGIKVLTSGIWIDSVGNAELYVDVDALKYSGTQYAYHVEVSVIQKVGLTRKPTSETLAKTWSDKVMGIVGVSNMATKIREQVKALVDKFINDYLSVNPKK